MPDTFKKGDAIKVRLSRRHQLDGELVDHPAKFVRYQPGQTGWADVDLEVAHSMHKGVKLNRLSVPLSQIIAALVLLALFVFPAKAQEPQTVSLQTVSQALAQNVTCTGNSQTFPVQNLGQISHQASAVSAAASFTLEIDGTDSTLTNYRISNPAVSFSNAGSVSYIAQGFGYYALEQVVVTCTPGATFSLSYSGGQTAFSNLIGPPGGSIANGGLTNEVQGLVAPGGSASGINPLLEGGLAPAINAGFTTVGLDNLAQNTTNIGSNFVGTQTMGSVPTLQQNGKEFALAFESLEGANTQTITLVAPWVPVPAITGCNAGVGICLATLANANAGQIYQRNYPTGGVQGATTDLFGVLTFAATPTTTVRQGFHFTAATGAFTSNTLANSTLGAAVICSAVCSGIGLTDTQGNIWKQVSILNVPASVGQKTLSMWVSTTPSSAAADTLTFTASSGTISDLMAAEIINATPANLTAPATFAQVDSLGNSVVRLDAQAPNQFTCNVTLSTLTTTQLTGCGAPTTISNQPVRIYVTDIQINTPTAGGTTTTIQLKTGTGTNCATGIANLSVITYPNNTAGLINVLGMRTPLVAPLQSAVCATQAGTTANTSTIEIHGFLAP